MADRTAFGMTEARASNKNDGGNHERLREIQNEITAKPNLGKAHVAEAISDGLTIAADDKKKLPTSYLLKTCAMIMHSEIIAQIREGGFLKGAILEAQDDRTKSHYAVFVLTNWRRGYCTLELGTPDRGGLFLDLERSLFLLRQEYRYSGTIAVKQLSEERDEKRYFRVAL